ncbi:unknown [Prevotella sp. CAG:924]|nr:unknown [Prevotella sp. CAG:924]
MSAACNIGESHESRQGDGDIVKLACDILYAAEVNLQLDRCIYLSRRKVKHLFRCTAFVGEGLKPSICRQAASCTCSACTSTTSGRTGGDKLHIIRCGLLLCYRDFVDEWMYRVYVCTILTEYIVTIYRVFDNASVVFKL